MAKKRASLSKRTRFEVFKRDGFQCQYCGAHPPEVKLVVDHIMPVAEGGEDIESNLVTACETCNQGKAARLLTQAPAPLAQRAADVEEREAQLRGFYEVMAAAREREENDAWDVADVFMDRFRKDGFRKDWMQSVRRFNAQLGVWAVKDAMEIAVTKYWTSESKVFRYFCGICWSRIREAGGESDV